MKGELDTTSPDSPEATINNIPCDQCGHPKTFHRQKKYYCEANVLYNDPVNNNEPIKAMCSCTGFANAEDDAKKKKDKEQKENAKEKDKEKQKPLKDHPPAKPIEVVVKGEKTTSEIGQVPGTGQMIH